MGINKPGRAGTMESSDIFIMIQPNGKNGIDIQLESIVMEQFEDQIQQVMRETLRELEVENIVIIAKDRGALDYTIKARLETAIRRGI